jgi:hypothetical protein
MFSLSAGRNEGVNMNNSDERDYDEEAANASLMAEETEYDASLFVDTWDAEPFDQRELVIERDWDDIPEWMIGAF